MGNFNYDKKMEHEKAAEKALQERDYAKAFFHTAQAAGFTYNLAEQCDGKLRQAYLANANDLTEIAAKLKAMSENPPAPEKSVENAVASDSGSAGTDEGTIKERPSVRLADVAGMEEVKKQIRLRMIEPFKDPERAQKHGLKVGGGLMLYGPPGTGKTFIARATAGELDLPFYVITPADIFGKYVGESEGNVTNLFKKIRSNPLSVVYFDEMESIFAKRTNEVHETTRKVISILLQELDGIDDNVNPILFLGGTNNPWLIDEAFLRTGRFDKCVYVGLPDAAARKTIVKNAFKNVLVPIADEALEFLIRESEGFSGADINGIAEAIRQRAFEEGINELYTLELFEKCFWEYTPSCSVETAARIAEWEESRSIKRSGETAKEETAAPAAEEAPAPEAPAPEAPAPAAEEAPAEAPAPAAPAEPVAEEKATGEGNEVKIPRCCLECQLRKESGNAASEVPAPAAEESPAPAAEEAPAPEAPAEADSSGAGQGEERKTNKDASDPDSITFDDIKGLDEAKRIIRDALIYPVRYPEVYKSLGVIPGSGLLLYGPPGTGKTMFGRAIANELNADFLSLTMADLRGKNPLQTVEMISQVFTRARMSLNGCVLFMDDCEELLSRPGNSKAYGISQFLNELDGVKKSGGETGKGQVFVLIATNRPWMIDGAFLRSGRISAAVYVGLPDRESRRGIIESALKDVMLADDVDLEKLTELTDGYSCAEIFHRLNGGGICNLARNFAGRRWVARIEEDPSARNRIEPLRWCDFEQALAEVTPSSVRDADRIAGNEKFRDTMSNRKDENK